MISRCTCSSETCAGGRASRDRSVARGAADPGLLAAKENTPQAVASLVTRLDSPRPNPFNPRVEVRFSVDRTGSAELVVFDLRGRRVKTLHRGMLSAGRHSRIWHGVDQAGSRVSSGVYFVKLSTETEKFTQRMTLVR